MQLLNKLSEILHKFVIFIFFFKIVVLQAASDSKPISSFNHLHQRSFLRKSHSQTFFKIGVPFPVPASDFLGNSLIFKKSVFYESLPLKLPVIFSENVL